MIFQIILQNHKNFLVFGIMYEFFVNGFNIWFKFYILIKRVEVKKMKNMKKINGKLFIIAIVSFFVLMLPTNISADPTNPEIGVSWIVNYDYWDDLPYCDDDAEALRDDLIDDPSTGWIEGFTTSNSNVHDEQWEIYDDEDYVDDVHFAYYAGHGWVSPYTGRAVLVFDSNIFKTPIDSADIYFRDLCDWGDENNQKLNWVGLACCEVGQKTQYALEGVHIICGWTTYCADKVYGEELAEQLMDGETVKDAWFNTGETLGDEDTTMRVIAEDISVANDHLYGYGTVYSDPTVDSTYYAWTQTV